MFAFKKTGLAVVLAAMAAGAQAGDFYAGASIGATKWHLDSEISSAFDTKDTGGKLFLGYGFNQNFALEGGYVNLGKAKASGNGASATFKGDGFYTQAVGIAPINSDFSVFGKLGFVVAKVKFDGSAPGLTVSESKTSTQPTFGVGAQYNLSKTIGLRAEWERFRGKIEDSKGDADLLSVGVSFSF
jgi:OOP family OmpA-OmpF porin